MEQENDIVKALRDHFNSLTPEQTEEIREKYFTDKRPKGWLSIEDYLPQMYAIDIIRGYSLFKVRDKEGNEFESAVSDHNTWYYQAKEEGVTHWLNE